MSNSGTEIAYKISEKYGEYLGNIVSSIINFSTEYANISYNCFKISYDSFKKQTDPTFKKVYSNLVSKNDNENENENDNENNI